MAVRQRAVDLTFPRIDRRYLIAGLAAVAAGVLVLVLTQPPQRTPVLVAGSDMAPGVPLSELDLDVRYVEQPDGLIIGDSVGDLAAWTLAVPLEAGEPVLGSLLRAPEMVAAPNILALALEPEHAVLGRLAAGDIVDAYLTVDGAPGQLPPTRLLAADIYVVSAELSDDPADRGAVRLLVAVDDDLAPLLASAVRGGTVDLVKVQP